MTRILCALFVLATLAACSSVAKVEFRAASRVDVPGATKLTPPGSTFPVFVESRVIIENSDIASARLTETVQGDRAVHVTLTDAGAEKLGEYTGSHLDQPIAILVNGELYSAPIVKAQLTRSAIIMGGANGLTKEQAELVVRSLNR